MIGPFIGYKLQSSATGNPSVGCKKQTATTQVQGFHHALAAPVRPQLEHKHRADLRPPREVSDKSEDRRRCESDAVADKDATLQTVEGSTPSNTLSCLWSEPIAYSGDLREPTQIAFAAASARLSSFSGDERQLQSIGDVARNSGKENPSPATGRSGLLISAFKTSQNAPQRMTGVETSGKGDASPAVAIGVFAQETRKASSAEALVAVPVEHTLSSFSLADSKALPPVSFQHDFAGSAPPGSAGIEKATNPARLHSPETIEALTMGFHLATNSKAMRLHIEVPELGSVSARFNDGKDGVSVTLDAKNSDSLSAVLELQRDMTTWLDHRNEEAQESGDLSGARLETPKGSDQGPQDRREENKTSLPGPDQSGQIKYADHQSAALGVHAGTGQAVQKWRHI